MLDTLLGLFLLVAVIATIVVIFAREPSWERSAVMFPDSHDPERVAEGDVYAIARCLGERLNGIHIDEVRFADNGTTLCVRFRLRRFEIADRRYGLRSRRLFQAYQHKEDAIDVVYASLDLVRQVSAVIASGYDELIDDKGWPYSGCVISVRASREAARSLNRGNLLPSQVLSHFEYRTNVNSETGFIGTVEPFDEGEGAPGPSSARDQEIAKLFSALKAAETSGTVEATVASLKQSLEDFIAMMRHELSNRRVEYLVIGFFDKDKSLIDWHEIRGHSVWVVMNSAAGVQLALAKGATSIVEFHNHPNPGSPLPLLEPSDADFQSSYALWKSCREHGIELLGSYIVSKKQAREYFFSTCRRLNISLEDSSPTQESHTEVNTP